MAITSPARILTLAGYKSIMRISDTGQDTYLTALLPSALRALEEDCGRKFCEYEVEGISIYCSDTGAVTAATVTVTETAISLSSTGGDHAADHSFTFSDAAYDTLTELVAAITALDAWTCTLVYATGTHSSTELTPCAAQSCIAVANTVTLGVRVDYTEYFDGTGLKQSLRPSYLPLQSITSIYDDTDRLFTDTGDEVDSDYYVMYPERIGLDGVTLNEGYRNVRVIYRGGYTPAQIADDDRANLRLAAALYLSYTVQRIPLGAVRSEVDEATGIETRFILGVPGFVRGLLEPYRRRAF